MEATSDCGAYVIVQQLLVKRLAVKMSKIHKTTFLFFWSSCRSERNQSAELQAGSSIMPAKV
ncbi:lyase family protein [Escherichia coli]